MKPSNSQFRFLSILQCTNKKIFLHFSCTMYVKIKTRASYARDRTRNCSDDDTDLQRCTGSVLLVCVIDTVTERCEFHRE